MLHGARSYLLQDDDGQVLETHSISAGLDYPGVGPEHSFLKESGRAEYVNVDDGEALRAAEALCLAEGILPALESAHAVAYAVRLAAEMPRGSLHGGVPLGTRRQGRAHAHADEGVRSMSRIDGMFDALRGNGAALIGYATAGFPDRETSLRISAALLRHCDALELGIPFSDPVLDGAGDPGIVAPRPGGGIQGERRLRHGLCPERAVR